MISYIISGMRSVRASPRNSHRTQIEVLMVGSPRGSVAEGCIKGYDMSPPHSDNSVIWPLPPVLVFERSRPPTGGLQPSPPCLGRRDRDALSNQLLDLRDRRCLDLWLEPGTTTREEAGAKITIDLVLGSQDLTPRLVALEVTEKIHADSDHLPIRTLIDIQTKTPEA
ncbi:uncharacterized protein KD926_006818 [Aspergillus affinis]|uniref:uncharacterized protein n=1 Tax=Aspergillus affinis TaxID=1070780 RepID=UPI0022FE82D1|nr:uncharacterized protein KD926_006818 [Aspergillus affinis]KAI9041422.1 hypothetical protein KD926_006818 [Aspergillus affinis]